MSDDCPQATDSEQKSGTITKHDYCVQEVSKYSTGADARAGFLCTATRKQSMGHASTEQALENNYVYTRQEWGGRLVCLEQRMEKRGKREDECGSSLCRVRP